jgi:hypothetical protein
MFEEGTMSLSKRVVETLIDLVEIKLSCMEIYDREDSREVVALEQCKAELQTLVEDGKATAAAVVSFAGRPRSRARAAAG